MTSVPIKTAAAGVLFASFLFLTPKPFAQAPSKAAPALADGAATRAQTVPGDRWMEIDLYWFDQGDIAGSVASFWDRFKPLYEHIEGDRGLILNVGWTVGYIMEWSGDLNQRITLPAGTGQQPWVQESAPLAGKTEERLLAWKQRFATPTMVPRKGYGPWTYDDLRQLTSQLRAEAARRGIQRFKVGSLSYAWNDAYGEVAPWAKLHPEAFSSWKSPNPGDNASGTFFDPAATLHRDSTKLGGLPQGIPEGMPVHAAFANQWGSLSTAVGLDAIMLRDSFGMPVPYRRAGPDGLVAPSPEVIAKRTESVSALVREVKTANPHALVMMYSNAATALGDWRNNGLDLERVAGEGFLDVWVDQTWAGAWNEAGVRHNSFWNEPTLGWTYQLAYTLMHAAVLSPTKVRHYPLIETFDAWESWDVLHTVPERLRWGIWAYSHASVKTPTGIKVPGGSYISWANQGKRLLSDDDVSFLNTNISEAVVDAHHVTEVYGPTLVYARGAAKWQAEHAQPGRDAKEWLDEQVGSLIKWPVPVLSATRVEWLPKIKADLLIVGAASHLSAAESSSIVAAANKGTPIALFGSPAGGIESGLGKLAGLHSDDTEYRLTTIQSATASSDAGKFIANAPSQFPIRQRVSRNSVIAPARVIYSVDDSPALTIATSGPRRIITWDPPDFLDEWDKELREIWGGGAAAYGLAAGALNSLLTRPELLHAASVDLNQTVDVSMWRTSDGHLHLLSANLEEGLRDDSDARRHATIDLPKGMQNLRWTSRWSGADFQQQNGTLTFELPQARSIQLEAATPVSNPR